MNTPARERPFSSNLVFLSLFIQVIIWSEARYALSCSKDAALVEPLNHDDLKQIQARNHDDTVLDLKR